MATTTSNLSLRKPESSDYVSVSLDIAGNMQTIDDKWASSAAANIGSAAAAGSALTVARTDHVHTVGSGTVSAPGLPVGESNTGLYRPGTGQLAATIAGVQTWLATTTGLLLAKTLEFTKQSSTPSAPGANTGRIYVDTNVAPMYQNGTNATANPLLRGRNRLANGGFLTWQRGTSSPTTTDNTYGPDRWRLLIGAANAATVARSTDVPSGGSKYSCALTVGSGNNNKFGIFQVIEGINVADLKGEAVSVRFAMKATSGISDVRVGVMQWTSTEDSVSADPISTWNSAGTNPTLIANWSFANTPANLNPTTSWATYRVEGISVSGSMANLAIFIWSDDTSTTTTTDVLTITDVQLESGSVCTDIERLPYRIDLNNCQRYFTKLTTSSAGPVFGFGLAYASTAAVISVDIPVSFRTTPTFSHSGVANFYLASSAFANVGLTSATIALYNPTVGQAMQTLQVTGSDASLTLGQATFLYAVNSSAALTFDAEL